MTQSTSLRRAKVLIVLLLLAGCGDGPLTCPDPGACGPDAGPTPDAGPGLSSDGGDAGPGEAPELRVELARSTVRMQPGGEDGFEVTVHRDGFVGDLRLSLEGLPSGVSAAPTTLPGVVASGWVTLGVGEEAAFGGPFPVTVVVESSDRAHHVEVPAALVIAGPPGSLDESFGIDGLSEPIRLPGWVGDLQLDSRGRTVIVGTSDDDSGPRLFLARITESGELDNGFADYGVWLDPEGGVSGGGMRVALVGDAPRVLAWRHMAGAWEERLVRAWDITGQPDLDFGEAGDWVASEDASAVASDGERLYVGGGRDLSVIESDGFVRTTTLDESVPSIRSMEFGRGALYAGFTTSVDAGSELPVLGRFTPEGRTDSSFGDGGVLRLTPAEDLRRHLVQELALLPDGGGCATPNHGSWEVPTQLIRFDAEGRLDTDFGEDGRISLDDDPGDVAGLAFDRDGRVLVLFMTWTASSGDTRELLRFTASGRLDHEFGVDGVLTLTGSETGFIQRMVHDPSVDRLVGCGLNEADDSVRCVRIWL